MATGTVTNGSLLSHSSLLLHSQHPRSCFLSMKYYFPLFLLGGQCLPAPPPPVFMKIRSAFVPMLYESNKVVSVQCENQDQFYTSLNFIQKTPDSRNARGFKYLHLLPGGGGGSLILFPLPSTTTPEPASARLSRFNQCSIIFSFPPWWNAFPSINENASSGRTEKHTRRKANH